MRELLYLELGFSDYASYGAALALSQGRPIRLAAQYPDKSLDFEFQTNPKPLAMELDLIHRFSGVDAVSTMSLPDLLARYSGRDLLGVISYSDAHIMNAALLAQHLGLPCADPTGIENCIFKDRAREMTNPLGHPVAYAVRVAENAGQTSPVGYPCVVKPVVGRASYGVSVCYDDAGYVAAVDEAIIYYRATSGGAESVPSILVEEYVDGPEYSGELIWDDLEGCWRLLGVTNTALMTPPPVRREIGHIFPWSFGPELDRTVEETLIAWLNAVGHRRGAAHIEFKVVANRPALIEINPRLPGGGLRRLIQLATGFDVVDAYQRIYLGEPQPWPGPLPHHGYSVLRDLLTERSGRVKRITEPAVTAPAVVETATRDPERLPPLPRDSHLAYAISLAPTPEAALHAASTHVEAIHVEYADGQ
ncbi:ATP-grasp domain-containing protein [Nonomuraea sp. NPDC003804]|uniref:ATP-grasp domain-containing protein n=1 Tax=Nonomuraea sp. NPDC003804 TaxID=3154547 RepID=UPI0033A16D4F